MRKNITANLERLADEDLLKTADRVGARRQLTSLSRTYASDEELRATLKLETLEAAACLFGLIQAAKLRPLVRSMALAIVAIPSTTTTNCNANLSTSR